ncbi:MAG: uracil-DNA glycosylase [Clostridia bacterium]
MKTNWTTIYDDIKSCEKCELSKSRTNVVIADGNFRSHLMLVGEGPGRDEDLSGVPFVGAAGKLLDKMLLSIDLSRNMVYIANIVKCRPPMNRNPLEAEANACLPYLRAQVALVRPKIIVCLGATAAKYIFDPDVKITRDRGKFKQKQGTWIICTYHPAALLRDPSKKREAYDDLLTIKQKCLELKLF